MTPTAIAPPKASITLGGAWASHYGFLRVFQYLNITMIVEGASRCSRCDQSPEFAMEDHFDREVDSLRSDGGGDVAGCDGKDGTVVGTGGDWGGVVVVCEPSSVCKTVSRWDRNNSGVDERRSVVSCKL